MKLALTIILILGCWSFVKSAEPLCPVCNNKTFDVTTQQDDRSKPSVNLAVWNRSICANLFYGKNSYICKKDGYAYEASLKTWNLKLDNHDGFAHPLDASIRDFPLPPESKIESGLVYSQEFTSLRSVTHSLLFWCVTDLDYFRKINLYAKTNGLSLTIEKERVKGQSIVKIAKQTKQVADGNPH